MQSSTVAVVSVTAQRPSPITPLRSVLQACVARFVALLRGWLHSIPNDRILLFVATPLSDQHNAVHRHHGIWGADLRWLAHDALRSPNVEIGDTSGLRFAGLAEIGEHDLFEAAEFVRTHDSSFLFLSSRRELTQARVRSLVDWIGGGSYLAILWDAEELLADASSDDTSIFLTMLVRVAAVWSRPVAEGEPWDRPPIPFHVLFAVPQSRVACFSTTLTAAGFENTIL